MRHGKKNNHLGRTDSHRKAMLSNMASSLIQSKRITTTLAKAKELRKYVEPLITKSKSDTTHSRRTVFSYLQNKDVVTMLFREVAEKVADRPGGYTRIIKLPNRMGDNAEMALIELVDYNEVYTKEGGAKTEKKATRRRGGKGGAKAAAPVAAAKAEEKEEVVAVAEAEEAPVAEVEEVQVEETVVAEEPATEEAPAEESAAQETPEATGGEEEKKAE